MRNAGVAEPLAAATPASTPERSFFFFTKENQDKRQSGSAANGVVAGQTRTGRDNTKADQYCQPNKDPKDTHDDGDQSTK